jgi:hypothetical protein
MSTPVTFTFVGPAAFARLLALRLTEGGLTPRYEPPRELSDEPGSLAVVRVAFAVAADALPGGEVVEVVRGLATRYHGRFEIEDLQGTEPGGVGAGHA